MTGYTVHTGSSDKFAAGWDQIFTAAEKKKEKKKGSGGKKSGSAKAKNESGKKSARKVKRGK